MISLLDDFLAAGPLISEQLRASLPPKVFLLESKELAAISEQQQPVPAVHVLYRDFRPLSANAAWEEIEQLWATVVVVRNVASLPSPASSELDAGPLMSRVIAALRPWAPAIDSAGALHLDTPLRPAFKGGFGYYPIGWKFTARIPARPKR